MSMLSNPAFGPRTALAYVTLGSVVDVWTAVWYFTIGRERDFSSTTWFWVAGLFFTGLTLIILGMALGPLGRAARKSELPPKEVATAEAAINQTAAAHPQPVVQAAPGQVPVVNPPVTQPVPQPVAGPVSYAR